MTRKGSRSLCLGALLAVSLSVAAGAAPSGRTARPVRVAQAVEADQVVGYGPSQVLLYERYFPSNPAEITRVDLDGSVDRSFGVDGTVHMYAEDIAVDARGRILLATSSGGKARSDARVTRLLPDGRLDGSFGVGGNADARRHRTGLRLAVRERKHPHGRPVEAGR